MATDSLFKTLTAKSRPAGRQPAQPRPRAAQPGLLGSLWASTPAATATPARKKNRAAGYVEGAAAARGVLDDLERTDNSITGQISSNVQSAVTQGPAMILKAVAQTGAAPIRIATDLIKDGKLRGDGGIYGAYKEYAPLPNMITDSLENSYRRNIDPLTPWNIADDDGGIGGLVDNWQEASDEHGTIGAIFEDVGNAALIGGAASKLIGRAPATTAFANSTEALMSRGTVKATPKSLSAASNAELRGTMISPLRDTVRSAQRAALGGDAKIATVTPIHATPRGTGLAGMARRAGYDTTANRLTTIGHNLERVTRVLDAPDNLTVGYQLQGAGKLAGALGKQVFKGAERLAPVVNRVTGNEDNVVNRFVNEDARTRKKITEQSATVQQADRIRIERESAAVQRAAKDAGLSKAQESAILNSLDGRYDDISTGVERAELAEARRLDEADGPELSETARRDAIEAVGRDIISRRFHDYAERSRPTYEGIKAIIDYRNNADPELTQSIVNVGADIEDMTANRTQVELDSGRLNPEQTGNTLLSFVVERERGKLEAKRDSVLREDRTVTPVAARADGVDRAQAAANSTIPDPPSVRGLVKAGEMRGTARAQFAALKSQHRTAQTVLNRAIDEYTRAEARDGINDPTVQALGRELDDLTDRTVALEQSVLTEQRKLNAAVGLSNASGEVQTVDVDGNPVDPQAQIQGEIDEIAQRPEPDLSNMPTLGAITTVAKEVVDDIKADLHEQIDLMTHGERPRIPGPDDITGEFDWYDRLSANEKSVLSREKWLAAVGEGTLPDDFARVVNARLGTDLSVDGAIVRYLELVDEFRDLRSRGNQTRTRREKRKALQLDDEGNAIQLPNGELAREYSRARSTTSDPVPDRVVETVAERMDMAPEVVRAALDGNAQRLREALGDDVRRGYDEVRAAWDQIEPEIRQVVIDEGRRIADEGGDLFEYVTDIAESYGLDGRDTMSMYGTTDGAAMFDWLAGTDPTVPQAFITAVTETPGPVQRRLIARLQASVTSSKAAVRASYTQQRSLRKIVDRVTGDAEARVEDMAGRVDVAEIQVEAAQAKLDAETVDRAPGPRRIEVGSVTPRSLDGWRRPQRTDPLTGRPVMDAITGEKRVYTSRFEKDRIREGRSNEVRRSAVEARRRVGARAKSYNDRISNLQTELGRSAQARLIEDINAPAVRGYRGVVRATGANFGGVISKSGDSPAQLTGLMARIAGDMKAGGGRAAMFAVAERMDQMGPFDSIDEKYNAFIDALEDEGVVIEHGTDLKANPDTPMADRRIADDNSRALANSLMAERALELVDLTVREAGATNMNLPYRVRNVIRTATSGFSQEVRNSLEARFEQYDRRRNKHLRSTLDVYQEVMPKKNREVAREALGNVRVYLDLAEEALNTGDGYLAEMYHRLAEEAPTTIDRMLEQGIDPIHLVGGRPITIASSVRDSSASGGVGKTKTRASSQSVTGGRPETLADYMRLEASEQVIQVNRDTMEYLKNHPGLTRRADSIIGDYIAEYQAANRGSLPRPDDLTARLEAAGWSVPPYETGPVFGGTPVMPTMAVKALRADNMGSRPAIVRAVSKMNRGFKMAVLPFSPLWQIGNVVGNTFMSAVMGQESVLDMPRLFNQAVKQTGGIKKFWEQGGLANWAPDELAIHGLSFGEHELIRQAWDADGTAKKQNVLQRAVGFSYRINEFADNSFRSMMFLDQMQKMSLDPDSPQRLSNMNLTASEAAVKHTLRALGDFTTMTAFEKRYVREVFPFYAWLRHQTLMTMRMPLYSPTRTVYLIALSDLLEDEDMADEFYQMVGSRIPLGGGRFLNLGGISPFSVPWKLPLDPTNPAAVGAMTPAIRTPIQMATGFDVGRLRNTTRPPEDRGSDLYGSETPASPLRNILGGGLKEMGYIAAGALPQTKMARDIALGTGEARWGSGERVGDGKYDDPNETWLDAIGAGMRVPRPDNMEDRLYELTQRMLKEQGR